MTTMIHVENVAKEFTLHNQGGVRLPVFDNVNFSVAAGEALVLAGASGIDRKVNLVGGFSGYRTAIIAETSVPVDAPASVETIRVGGNNGRPDLAAALGALAERHVQNLFVEPGQRLTAALLEADLVDRFALITLADTIGTDGVPASPDGPIADLLGAAGLRETGRQALGDAGLTLYERPARAD